MTFTWCIPLNEKYKWTKNDWSIQYFSLFNLLIELLQPAKQTPLLLSSQKADDSKSYLFVSSRETAQLFQTIID